MLKSAFHPYPWVYNTGHIHTLWQREESDRGTEAAPSQTDEVWRLCIHLDALGGLQHLQLALQGNQSAL